ncbi:MULTISPECIES: monofunctional biosynthetic peptidoglycan transglycosylase [Flavobacterium]|uniref:Biosynthetic peptidoglycan transglycosylase n=1 Tax=Flavobacterium covae TaxID=2906076 RepID=A0ABW8PFZ7_9FLAO|nr:MULTISPECIES: monofunctional biosynthetic peptidoglycan transglycosylase [Flavobacterium]OXA83328.1 monofunctional biosynthetic peptidoglycan transglycosylase [Flavobacterium columnare NBRC 100251 = ATCC 23463]AMA50486.1 monofunctional biosynthetic peptidoglycan transglycosylase [Flavobacterium covae]AND63992.1 monofunctional biosynthetic peptidoglycan transglycosylase [Flavobacterium covae]MCJ1807308.1 monofunctional biosynthetic peptidoglycan transglycosylase [Flavobacterium covae]MCJ1809
MTTKKNINNKTNTKTKSKTPSSTFMTKVKLFLWKCFLYFNVISIAFVFLFKYIPVPFTPLMIIRAIENKAAGKEVIFSHDWVPIDDLSLNLQKAVISSEDGLFLQHNGFDFSAMNKAFKGNLKGKKLKGGSTISQQTAKNIFLWQGRSYLRKALEAYYTVLIELVWGKKRIMEVYLNSIEMGNGIYGAEAACQYWFHKSSKSLTKYEAASIAAILPSPRKYKAVGSSNYVEKRKNKTIRVMRHIGTLEY